MFAGFARDTRTLSFARLSTSRRTDSPRWPALNEAFENCTRFARRLCPEPHGGITSAKCKPAVAGGGPHPFDYRGPPEGGSVPVARIHSIVSSHDTSHGIELQDYSENGITL